MTKFAVTSGLVAGSLLVAFTALADMNSHPHLKAAHGHIEKAVSELGEAKNGKQEFGTHREKAEELLKEAQREIDAAVSFADQHPGR